MDNTVSVLTELSDAQALALAQLVKRVGWQEVRINAVDDDGWCHRASQVYGFRI